MLTPHNALLFYGNKAEGSVHSTNIRTKSEGFFLSETILRPSFLRRHIFNVILTRMFCF